MHYEVITFGSATQDVFMKSKNLKVVEDEKFFTGKGLCASLGSKMHMDEVVFTMGGCGANTALTFGLQGLKTAYAGQIGKDYAGDLVKKELSKAGIFLDLLKETSEYQTAFSLILSLPEVGRTILEKLGACHELKEEDLKFENLKSEWFYIGSLSGNSSKVFKPLVDFASDNNIKIMANPGSTQLGENLEETRDLLDKIDILILNQEESAKLTGLNFEQEKEIFDKLDEMVKGLVIMTKGPKGVIVSDGEKYYSAGIPESDLIDRTGAGDAFASGFLSGWINKNDITYAIQLATANATSVLQTMGAGNGLLKKGEWGSWDKIEVKINSNIN